MATTAPSAYQAPGSITIHNSAPMQPAPSGTPSPSGAPATPAAPAAQAPGAPAPTPPASLGADPAYNAFLAQLGLTDASLRDAAALKAGNLEANLQPALDANQRNLTYAEGRNTSGFNARGLVNSSDDINAANRLQQTYGDRAAAMQGNVGSQIASLYAALAQQLANGQVSAANNGTAALANGAVQSAVNNQANPYTAAMAQAVFGGTSG